MLADKSVKEFIAQTASSAPAPGGGSIAALSGALACALVSMVASLTVNNQKYKGVSRQMEELIDTSSGLIDFFIRQMDADAQAFDKVIEAYKMPKSTQQEKSVRSEIIRQRLKTAAEVPMAVAVKALEAMDMIGAAIEKGNSQAVTDGAVSAMMARTAVLSALYNVEINLASIKDNGYREEMKGRLGELREKAAAREKEMLDKVKI